MQTDRTDLYQKVTDTVIAQLEAGTVPWVQPWRNGQTARHVALPHNAVSGRCYSGINIALLWCSGTAYGSHGWLTFKQALEMGGNVAKGQHGTLVVYADKFIPQSEKQRVAETGDKPHAVYFLKGYTVFNREQCEGLKPEPTITPPTMPQMVESADRLIQNSHARIIVGGDRAAYYPSYDHITIPPMSAYEPTPINWYRTCLHELGHWTGADQRLARNLSGGFGSHDYAREELTAEMSAAFTCAVLGIEPTVRHADYIASWLKCLREDKRAIVQAASRASKASDFLLAFNEPVAVAEAAD